MGTENSEKKQNQKHSMAVPEKIKNELPCDLAISFLSIHSKNWVESKASTR